jgi:hypothetical protein
MPLHERIAQGLMAASAMMPAEANEARQLLRFRRWPGVPRR